MDTSAGLLILKQARESITREGFVFPEIKEENVRINNDMPCYFADWDVREEALFRPSMQELEKAIFSIMGKEWKPMEDGFWMHYGDNYKKETPEIWAEKSKPENASKNISDPTLQGYVEEKDDMGFEPVEKVRQDLNLVAPDEGGSGSVTPPTQNSPSYTEKQKPDYEIVTDGEETPETEILSFGDDTYIDLPD